jgi:hypothetical protein
VPNPLQRVTRRLEVERDVRAFRRRYGSIVGAVPEGPKHGTALLASLTFYPLQLKLEGMLAKALQLQGLEVAAAVPQHARAPRQYLGLFGVSRFASLDESPELQARAETDAAALLGQVASVAELKELRYRSAFVGRQALSTASRHLHEGGLDLASDRDRAAIERLLALSVRATLAAERLLDELEPQLLVFNERNYAQEGPLSDMALARGLNVVQFVAGFEDDTLVFKRFSEETRGLHPRSLSDASWQIVRELPWDAAKDGELDDDFARRYDGSSFLSRWNQLSARPLEHAEIVRRLGLDPAKKTAVLFSHVLWDANMFYGRDLFEDQERWFVETVRAACENDRVNWVVKLHPANAWKLRDAGIAGELTDVRVLREQLGPLPRHVQLLMPDTDISTRSLFDLTDWGITIRGSVGFELPCFGVPVLTAGTGYYSGRGFTLDSDTAEEYLARVRAIDEVPALSEEETLLARRHAYALFRLRQTRFTSFRTLYGWIDDPAKPIAPSIEIRARSAAELAKAEDLREVGEWLAHSRASDFLALPQGLAPPVP